MSPEEIADALGDQGPLHDPDDPLVGTVLREKWKVLERIGAGSFGTVYKVQEVNGGWIEALKILSVDRLRGPEAENMRKRFLREAQIMKRLGQESPHIVGLSTYEQDTEAGLIYFLMEHVEGRVLSHVIHEEGPFTVERATRVGLQVCDALMVAHEGPEPVVHRDLKLENLMLTVDRNGDEVVKVLDFGIAKLATQEQDSRLTTVGTLGTPGYAAPEQLRAGAVDGRTDLFAFGVILYSLLTGRNPWLGHVAYQATNQTYELMAASDRGEVLPMSDSGVDVPPAMAAIVIRLLRRDPEERFQSARELKDALSRVQGGGSVVGARGASTLIDKPSSGGGSPGRRLAAVWFADLVGYSTLSSTDEEAALAVLETFHGTARRVIEEGGGRLVQFIGDAAFAEFGSTEHAVRTATEFMKQFALETSDSEDERLLRIGVHVGDVLIRADGDLFGDGVNVAARIQNEAEPGQILVSQDVWRQLKQRRDFSFASVGERSLKGIGAPVWLFEVSDDDKGAASTGGPPEGLITADLPTFTPKRVRRVAEVALAYVAASVVVYFTSAFLVERLSFAAWVEPAAIGLLAVGFIILLTTAWVQSRPGWQRSASEQPPWAIDVPDFLDSVSRNQVPALTWARAIVGGVAAFGLLFGAAGAYVLLSGSGGGASATGVSGPESAVAFLPLVSEAPDPWAQGVPALLGLTLDGVDGIRTVDTRVVSARGVLAAVTGGDAIAMGRTVGARFVTAGTLARSADGITADLELYDVQTGQRLGAATATGAPNQLIGLVAQLSAGLVATGALPIDPDAQPDNLGAIATSSPEALEEFIGGESHLGSSDWSAAVASFQRAQDADPDFAMASLRLSLARLYASLPEPGSGDPDAERAASASSRLPAAERLLAEGLSYFLNGSGDAVASLQQATTDFPEDPDAWFVLGDALYHQPGPGESAYRDALQRAVELTPGFGPAYAHLIEGALASGDPTTAATVVTAFQRESPNSPLLASLEAAIAAATATDVPDDEPVGPDRPPVDPLAELRGRYTQLSATVGGVRDQARSAPHPSLRARLATADSIWAAATAAAGQDRFVDAISSLSEARPLFGGLVADNETLTRIESDRSALAQLRTNALDQALVADAAAAEREADQAISQGRYQAATDALVRATRLLRQAAVAPDPPPDDPAGGGEPEPDPIQPEVVAQDVLRTLKAAMEAEDLSRVRAVWTSISPEEADGWERLFRAASSLTADYRVVSIVQLDGRLVTTVRSTYVYATAGREQPPLESTQIFELEESGSSWVIVASRTVG